MYFETQKQWPLGALDGWQLVNGKQREKIVCASVLWLHERMVRGTGYRGTSIYFIVEYDKEYREGFPW